MCFFFSLFPATFWAVIGYFVLFSSTRADGPIGRFGRGLAIWVFVLSGLIVLAGAFITINGWCPMGDMMHCMIEDC